MERETGIEPATNSLEDRPNIVNATTWRLRRLWSATPGRPVSSGLLLGSSKRSKSGAKGNPESRRRDFAMIWVLRQTSNGHHPHESDRIGRRYRRTTSIAGAGTSRGSGRPRALDRPVARRG